MNTRVLELLKNPKNIQSEDLVLLQEEINSYPYIQNIRALHLYGVHLYDKENYQKALSATAAYTTDKKILYQLINGKPINFPKPYVPEEEKMIIDHTPSSENIKAQDEVAAVEDKEETPILENKDCDLQENKALNKVVFVNGERNRILFEGEEDFLNETSEASDLIVEESVEEQEFSDLTPSDVETVESNIEESTEDLNKETVFVEVNEAKDTLDDDAHTSHLDDSSNIESSTVELVFKPEEAIQEEVVNDESELSFHGTDAFLPDVKIDAPKDSETHIQEVVDTNINKHEDEMRRLIEEVEKRMKSQQGKSPFRRSAPKEEEVNTDINFTETQSFEVLKAPTLPVDEIVEEEIEVAKMDEPIVVENSTIETEAFIEEPEVVIKEDVSEEIPVEVQEDVVSTWKPMNFVTNLPDSLINKKESPIIEPVNEIKVEAVPESKQMISENVDSNNSLQVEEDTKDSSEEVVNDEVIDRKVEALEDEESIEQLDSESKIVEEKETEDGVPVLNFSFFGSEISSLKINKEPVQEDEKPVENRANEIKEEIKPLDSNVPGFINTWQSWLKIDRTEEEEIVEEVDIEEVKSKAIENFIETNPKISQLKEEVTYVVKEKNDDISHLMTETLATLYVEQKLYAKAIKAFKTLIGKHPDKKEYFEEKIKEIKEIRGRN